MKTETLQDSLDTYRDKIGGNRRNVSAAYELALKAGRPYLSGDQISYYVAGRGAQGQGRARRRRLVAEYDPANPDENVEYYQAKLAELYDKFKPYAERRGLFSPAEIESAAQAPEQQLMFEPGHESRRRTGGNIKYQQAGADTLVHLQRRIGEN